MIWTALRAHWLNLKRDRIALLLTFVVPIVFFSIFAMIFSSINQGGGARTKIVVLDQAQNDFSRRIEKSLREDKSTFIFPYDSDTGPKTEEEVEKLVSDNKVALGLVFPEGLKFDFQGGSPKVRVYADTRKNPIAYQMINGILQKVVMTAAPEFMVEQGLSMMERFGGALTDQQKKMFDLVQRQLKNSKPESRKSEANDSDSKNSVEEKSSGQQQAIGFGGLIATDIKDVRDEADKRRGKQQRALVSSYASGIAVMFLLFSMAGAAGGILEERETGTLDRVLDSKLGLNGYLISYWLFTAALGFAQVFVMFLWGWYQFGLDLFSSNHLTGFVVVTAVTSAAAASFGLMLGALCTSRGQLNGISTTVILIMSALGGSMIPRFVLKMNSTMETVGLCTFNAWALDAYENVFWRDKSLVENGLQIGVLAVMTVVFLSLAWTFAQRWKRL